MCDTQFQGVEFPMTCDILDSGACQFSDVQVKHTRFYTSKDNQCTIKLTGMPHWGGGPCTRRDCGSLHPHSGEMAVLTMGL